ncbi:D-alanyl-D-alanine carboxypeptidase family protein [Alkalihalobacillus trypoxylicola]|uniref:Peptidase S11 D-alanyl-D-alanine carboxypeptidase A N-terminal domain-containing protein n=1 Tax=Alkalihalobacillus trypoxylicola TaxID=519424 RepID=A0A161PZE7_9BACI|nr:serine hydrolase [Alkalihalobacillus trypoxylicola]KYG28075.1 hypothetical protein AZF04_09210 [Alkalihalobacillus trypoxylicola]
MLSLQQISSISFLTLLLLSHSTAPEFTWPHHKVDIVYDFINYLEEEVYSEQVYLYHLNTNRVVYKKNEQQRVPVASLTKIMTTLIAIEQLQEESLNKKMTVPEDIFPMIIDRNLSVAGYSPNEEVEAIDLLYGTMLPSGADASISLAIGLSGTEQEFIRPMNQKAEQLKMGNTHFSNVTGMDQDHHYSTVEDMAILLKYALNNPLFKDVFSSENYSTASTNLSNEGLSFQSRMFHLLEQQELNENIEFIGGKTGFTNQAGLCLASYVMINSSEEYLLITTGADGNTQTPPYHTNDAITIYNQLVY